MDVLTQQFTGLTLKPPAIQPVTYQPGSASKLLYDEFRSSQLAPPPPKTNTKILQDLLNELECRENICYHIKDKIRVAKQERFCLPSQRFRIEEEHNRRMREFVKTGDMSRNGRENQNTEKSNIGAGGYAMEEYKAYERQFSGRPDPTLVGALFGILSQTECDLRKLERDATGVEQDLAEKLPKAQSTFFELLEEIETMKQAMESRNSADFGLPETKAARRMSNRRNESKKKTRKGNSKEQIVVANREGPKRRSAQRKGRRLSQRFLLGCGNMTR